MYLLFADSQRVDWFAFHSPTSLILPISLTQWQTEYRVVINEELCWVQLLKNLKFMSILT